MKFKTKVQEHKTGQQPMITEKQIKKTKNFHGPNSQFLNSARRQVALNNLLLRNFKFEEATPVMNTIKKPTAN